MSNNKDKTVSNVPNLRFPEFSEEWQRCKLGEIAEFLKDRVNTQKLSRDNYITTENMLSNYGGIFTAPSISLQTNVMEFFKGCILFSNIRPYLKKVWLSDRDGGCSSDVLVLRTFSNCVPTFLHYIVANDRFISFVMSGAKGVKMPRGDKEQMKNYNVGLPSLPEQTKIGKFLSLLDERIKTQSKIIEDLKILKAGIIEEVYCSPKQIEPQRRFETNPLITYKMNDFCMRVTNKNKENSCSLVLTVAAQYGLVDQETFFNKSVASENLTGYYLLQRGDFAYNRSYSTGYTWGAVKRLDKYTEGVLSPLYICFRVNGSIIDSDYLSYYFESTKWHKGVSEISGEGVRNHGLLNISVTDYFNTEHRFAPLKEQKRIASMLNSITKKEQVAIELGKLYHIQKQHLLLNMFI